jgi:hypothetical protein
MPVLSAFPRTCAVYCPGCMGDKGSELTIDTVEEI